MKYQKAIEKLPFTEKGHANAQKQSTTAHNNTFEKKKKYSMLHLLCCPPVET